MKKTTAALTVLLSLSAVVAAEAKLARTGTPSVRFLASGPAGLKIEGKGDKLTVDEDGDKVKFTVPLAELQTGISLRDRHMRDKYLEVAKFPNAEMVVARADIKFPSGDEVKGKTKGTLTIHGVTKPVEMDYVASGKDGAYKVAGSLKINFNDFGIEVPSYLGVTVKPDIELLVDFEVSDKS